MTTYKLPDEYIGDSDKSTEWLFEISNIVKPGDMIIVTYSDGEVEHLRVAKDNFREALIESVKDCDHEEKYGMMRQ